MISTGMKYAFMSLLAVYCRILESINFELPSIFSHCHLSETAKYIVENKHEIIYRMFRI